MPAGGRSFDHGTRVGERILFDIGSEFRETRLALGLSQQHVADASRISRPRYSRAERGKALTLSIVEYARVAATLGLSPSVRVYPGGPPVRDSAQASRLRGFLADVRAALTYRIEVALPASPDRLERRAWDAMLFGHGQRTAIELEMRLRDVQAMRRRVDLKRRDDPTEHVLVLVADTRTNRRVLAEFAELFQDLPRLRRSAVRADLRAGRHPRSGLLLV